MQERFVERLEISSDSGDQFLCVAPTEQHKDNFSAEQLQFEVWGEKATFPDLDKEKRKK